MIKGKKLKEKTSGARTIAHSLLSDARLCPCTPNSPPFQVTPSVYILGMMFSGVEYPFGQFRSPAPAVLSPAFLCTSSLAKHETQKSP